MKKKQKGILGFTLLELLVVISIIGILLALGSVAYSTAQRKGRDAKRRGDIKALQSGFEQYYSGNSNSYGSCADMKADSTIFPGGEPLDPRESSSYDCTATADGYCACAGLETGGGNAGASPCPETGLPAGAVADESYFCLSNLQ